MSTTPIEVPLADEEQSILAYVKMHGGVNPSEWTMS